MFFKKDNNQQQERKEEYENIITSLNNLYTSICLPTFEKVFEIEKKLYEKDSFDEEIYIEIKNQMSLLTKSVTTLCDKMEDFANSHKNFFTKFHEILDNLKDRKIKEDKPETKPRVRLGRKPKKKL